MKTFTGYQWLLIDAATQYGHDKMTFEERIKWTEENLDTLETLIDTAETKPLFYKAVLAIRKAQAKLPSGHMVGVDGCCSGVQIMSALTGCIAGATATGMVDPDVRADAYSSTTDIMNRILGGGITISRKDAKRALMTSFYGSKEVPIEVFEEDTPALAAFYEAAQEVAPGAWDLLHTLVDSWQPYALSHEWKLPDGFDAVVRVMNKRDIRIEVDELDHARFTYEFYENIGKKKGVSNAANMVHSVDAYVLREMHRRCNYDKTMLDQVSSYLVSEMTSRMTGHTQKPVDYSSDLGYFIEQWERSTLATAVILPYITLQNAEQLPDDLLGQLLEIVNSMLKHKSFPLVTIHDEFKAHANYVDFVRSHYKDILAEIAESKLIDDLLSQIYGEAGSFPKLSSNLGSLIRQSNYALC